MSFNKSLKLLASKWGLQGSPTHPLSYDLHFTLVDSLCQVAQIYLIWVYTLYTQKYPQCQVFYQQTHQPLDIDRIETKLWLYQIK